MLESRRELLTESYSVGLRIIRSEFMYLAFNIVFQGYAYKTALISRSCIVSLLSQFDFWKK